MKKWLGIFVVLTTILVSCQDDKFLKDETSQSASGILKSGEVGSIETWPGVFEPSNVVSLYFRMTADDWNTVRFDATNEILRKAWFRAAGENEILVELRRKSSRALPSEQNPLKIGMKVDINYVKDQLWRGVSKLSLENGSDAGPVAEGVAWNLYELASIEGFYGPRVHAGLAAWVKVFIKVCEPDDGAGFLLKDEGEIDETEYTYLGVYINVEQRNKQFMKNRAIYQKSNSYQYEVDDIGIYLINVGLNGDEGGPHSETYNALNFPPFQSAGNGGSKKNTGGTTLTDAQFMAKVEQYINMQAMLTQGAIDAFTTNNDALLSHGKNFKFVDFQTAYTLYGFSGDKKRVYYPWDMDAVFGQTNYPIYGQPGGRSKIAQSEYQKIILNHPYYRVQYNNIMLGLINGPLSPVIVGGLLDQWKAAADQALRDDPYELYGTHMSFDDMKQWMFKRADAVRQLVLQNNNPVPR
jgi:hypothetical protein